jgi:anti-anti-sigma factor
MVPPGDGLGCLNVECRQDVAVLNVIGEHDLVTAGEIQQLLEHLLERGLPTVVCLTEATFIDSSTIGAICKADHGTRRIVLLVDEDAPAYRTLEITRVFDILACRRTLAEAMLVARQLVPFPHAAVG